MPLANPDILTANMVLISGPNAQPFGISPEEIRPLLSDAQFQLIGQPVQQAQLTSLREQVIVVIAGNTLILQDQSGVRPPKGRLAEIAVGFAQLLQQKNASQFTAYGYNFAIAFDAPDDAPVAQLIRDRFVKADRLRDRGLDNIQGAGLRIYYTSSEAQCDLKLEPLEGAVVADRFQTFRFFAQVNYHYALQEGQGIPPLDTMRGDYLGKYDMFTQALERLLQ